ncbi:MAG TPA: ABC transporter permease [Thermoanaerobaculia bacterium]|nr:ABC transporter permease [Thermoanaerobaculia bacterium]
MRWLESIGLDVRFGVRSLLQSPGITVAVLLALALGIGANTAVFSVARATLGQELPYRDPDRLVAVFQSAPSLGGESPATLAIFEAWRRRSRSFEALAALSLSRTNITSPGRPELVQQAWVTANFFQTAGAEMAAGRGFREDEVRRRARVAVLSYPLFLERYGGQSAALRQGIVLDGTRYAVVGVAPPGFSLFGDWAVWLPDTFRQPPGDSGWHLLRVFGRLRPGASLEQADREMEAVSREMAKREPEVYAGWTVRLAPMRRVGLEETRRTLGVLGLFVVCVLLIACADVAGLLLARATGREREIALRAALGADRGRLVRRMLAESLLLFLAGGLLALPLAAWGARALARLGPAAIADAPRGQDIGLHGGAFLFTFGLALAAGLLFGLMPALAVTGRLAESLKDGRRLAGRPGGWALRDLLVAGQVALTAVLIAGAGLLAQSFDRLREVDPGFRPSGIVALKLQPPSERYADPGPRAQLYRRVLEAARKVPGSEAAALVDALPFSGETTAVQFTVEGLPNPPAGKNLLVALRCVTPGYFEMLGIERVRGRLLRDSDQLGAAPVVIVNETMAAHHWPGQDPIGKRFGFGFPSTDEWMTVVGVVKDTRRPGLTAGPALEAYRSLYQEPQSRASLLLRVPDRALEWTELARQALRQADPGLTGGSPTVLEELISPGLATSRFKSRLALLFAALALGLAAVGIYGVVSYSVARRTHEIGIRMALGAQLGGVLRRVILQGMAPVAVGLAVGLAAARLLSGLLADQLYGVRGDDPLTLTVAAVVIVSASLVATYFPAHRATQVAPVAALREE